MKTKDNQELEKVIKAVGGLVAETVDHYFIPGTKMTLVLRHPSQSDPIVLSDDNELKKVISAIEQTILMQMNYRK